MKKLIFQNLWTIYLVCSLQYLGYSILSIEWWAITMPIILFVEIARKN